MYSIADIDFDVTFNQFFNRTQSGMFHFKLVSVNKFKVFRLLNGLLISKATSLDKISDKIL